MERFGGVITLCTGKRENDSGLEMDGGLEKKTAELFMKGSHKIPTNMFPPYLYLNRFGIYTPLKVDIIDTYEF